jgi:hypothetical protein
MTRLRPTPNSIPTENSPACAKRISARGRHLWLTGLALACCCAAPTDLRAGNPSAEAIWYAPYTPEGNCAPYQRTYGYTRTRWHRWPNIPKAMPEPETITTPRPGVPPTEPGAESSEELPEPDTSMVPDANPEPGPREEEPDMAPAPPTGSEPPVPPGVNDEPSKPSQDLDDLFPEENATPKDESKDESMDEPKDESSETPSDSPDDKPPATDDSAPDAGKGDAMPQSRHGGGRRTSFNSSSNATKMHWRRSSRLAPPEALDARTSVDDGRAASIGGGATQSTGQEGTATKSVVRSSLNPLRGTRSLPPTSVGQSQSLADTNTEPAVADWSASSLSGGSPSSRGNPLRGGQ